MKTAKAKCCNHDCREGRLCPNRPYRMKWFKQAAILMVIGVILGLLVSKYSAQAAYKLGHSVATRNIDEEHRKRLAHFENHRMRSCISWYWNDSAANIRAAQYYMCQNKEKWK